jgi:integrase/recombinase XerD
MVGEAQAHAKRRGRLGYDSDAEVLRLRLGRYPFAAAIGPYLEARFGVASKSTYDGERGKLTYLAGVFEQLKGLGLVTTTDPRHLTRKDIQGFLYWMKNPDIIERNPRDKGKPIKPVTQETYIRYLRGFLRFYRNFVLEEMKLEGVKFPRPTKKPVKIIPTDDVKRLFAALPSLTGWRGTVGKGMCSICLATGIRPKEIRKAHIEDLNIEARTFYVRHPKGEGSWAEPTTVALIREDLLPVMRQFLAERGRYLKENGIEEATPLFPNLTKGPNGFYSQQGFNAIKQAIEEKTGVEFLIKEFRPTLCSMTVNNDLSKLPAMSIQLRHSTVATTQKSYLLIEQGRAGNQLHDSWKDNPIIEQQKPLIEKKWDMSGYQ